MIDVATHAVQHHRHWKRVYKGLQHKGNGKALIAVARQMLLVIWHLLSKAEADRNADPGQVDYPPFGCASIIAKPDSRTFEGRLLSGRSSLCLCQWCKKGESFECDLKLVSRFVVWVKAAGVKGREACP
jgi:hypothetical protein